jgi:hypothetical protein
MSFKVGVYGGGTGSTKETACSNGCAFSTFEEATRAGVELLMRWFMPSDFVVLTSDEPVNYRMLETDSRPVSLS